MLAMIDNYDSFTYNLVQYFGQLGQQVSVFRNDKVSLPELEQLAPQYLVVSPGPCTPNQAGISVAAIAHFADKMPVLGVCLGHQSIAQAFGGNIVHAQKIMHGKTSMITHTGAGIFAGLANPFRATRYHSLVIENSSMPSCFDITAWTEEGEIMAVKHKEYAIEGVQFHPESIDTEYGHALLQNFLNLGINLNLS